jgi:hypothetical protein
MPSTRADLERLCGEYGLLKFELQKKKLEIIKTAHELGLQEHIMKQMEW